MSHRGGSALARAAAAGAAMVVAGCGQPTTGQVIAVRSGAPTTPQPQTIDANALTQRISSELAQANGVTSIGPDSRGNGTLPPLTSTLGINGIEHLSALEQLGFSLIDSRLHDVANLEALVNNSTRLSPQSKSILLGRLASAYNGLSALRVTISNETLLDQARVDVRSIENTYHVQGLLDPQVRLVAAADGLLQLSAVDTNQLAGLNRKLAADQRAGIGTGNAAALLGDMATQIGTVTYDSQQALSALIALDPAGYPGNKGTLDSMRNLLNTAHVAAAKAAADATSARAQMP